MEDHKKKLYCELCGRISYQGVYYKKEYHRYCKKCRKPNA